MSGLEPQVIAVIAGCLGGPARSIGINDDLVHDLGCDSLNIVELVEALNAGFQIVLAPGEIRTWRSVADVIGSVRCAQIG
ncbi:acyl carrier protein [Pseudomonas rubra]|uniref:Acyl carrier protein n=1 Tax=Pseudomonas rubra TaxID=2942627 RepID=A0ABT5PCH6_9PSED|nr:acyl carrier protein [Pseudomonas rubra]MDD1016002.1 acyl carrier protein [Pseudomonas rubra]MDD1039227.1 acyl carrier protein [Pseudomonas rubra]MDD1155197.1 acyl carrier protein [Pseudomonas rubra]